ncbi:MAG TPA: D-glucuronyl C5-epimerase family protein [Gaiellaceae bacterium]|nr:D-glucuronyl C5-epimerase family protein [Gaiellaceae bacterium]
MSVRGPVIALLCVLAGLLVAAGATAAPPPVPGEKAALAAVKHAVKAGRLDRATATAARAEILRAVHLARVLPRGRREHVLVALGQAAALAGHLTQPRAVAIFGQLRANDDYFAHQGAPRNHTDITGPDGIVYRYFTGMCFEFHPLANFSALNAHVTAKDATSTQQLADALAARGVSLGKGGTGWEYYFHFEGGRPPWLSGMAQAVAAQAFARAAALVPSESTALLREAKAAFGAIPGRLTTQVAAGPWIRLYSFRTVAILNAQLQSVISLESYAQTTADPAAASLASQMKQAAVATLPRFDTGYWSYYSLAGAPAPLSYHQFVVQLLRKLAPEDPLFGAEADRFAAYVKEPPAFKLGTAPVGALRFWLSKPASVTVATAAGSGARLGLGAGWHTLRWRQPKRAGAYGIKVTAIGPAGNRASFAALPLVRVTSGSQRPAAARKAGSATAPTPAFLVGAGIDGAAQAAQAQTLGLGLVGMAIPWQPGQTAPAAGLVSSLQGIPSGLGLVGRLIPSELPTDDAGRTALGSYAASLAAQVPALRDLVLAPAPAVGTASAYADALAAVRAAVVAARAGVAVGPSIDGSTPKPQLTATVLAKELAHDGSRADVVAFLPAAAAGTGKWAAGDVGRLEGVLAKSLGSASPVILEPPATPTTVPPSESGAYSGGPPATAGAVPPAAQASLYGNAVGAASCSPSVAGVLLDRLVDDGATPQPPTGLFYAGGDPKPSAAAVKSAIASAARGAVVCPGTSAKVAPTTLTFPQDLASPASVTLGCNRDCLYLVTLDRADGRPVAASRGSLAGGASPQTITLPQRKLAAGRYRVDVRLVSGVNPGPLTRLRSPFLTVG